MGNEKLAWVFLLMLVYARRSEQYTCSKSEECGCLLLPGEEIEMRCPEATNSTFVIEVKTGVIASLRCNLNPPWPNFTFQSTAPVEEVNTFMIRQCSLPDLTLREIAQKIGVEPTDTLRFESYKNLSSTLERRHLSGFPRIKKLGLHSNSLTNLPNDLLQDLPELRILELRNNNVVLPVDFFKHVPKLRTLELGVNKLTRIDSNLFQNVKQLNYLNLWGNQLTTFEEHTFDNLSELGTLEIGFNKLVTLPREIFKPLTNLSILQMNSNKFSSLPEDLLSKNLNLTVFGLNANNGNWTGLPSGFLSNLPNLKDVSLSKNKLTVLPEDIFWGSFALRTLNLKGNLLTTLPTNIFKDCKNLVTLDLSSNRLSNLTDGTFKALNKLEILDLQKNNLASISSDLFLGLLSLKEINLENNGIWRVDERSFYPLEALEIARLSYNEITFADNQLITEFGPTSPLSNCLKLKELQLAHNNISRIFYDWNIKLSDLRILDLTYNQISLIVAGDMQFFSKNITVNIAHNNISRIDFRDIGLIASTQKLYSTDNRRIFVDNNPIICDCSLYHFIKYLNGDLDPDVQKMVHVIPGQLKCAGAEHMHEILVSDLNHKTFQCYNSICPKNCECWFRLYDFTIVANCSYRNFTTVPERINGPTEAKAELNLIGNLLTEMPVLNISQNVTVTKLLLSHNHISGISSDAIPLSLETLELDHNNLVRLNTTVLGVFNNLTSLVNLTLHGNPWKCDCEAKDFLSFLQAKYKNIPQISNIVCENNNKSISKLTTSDLCPVAVSMIVGISFGIALLGLLIGILAALYYRYQVEIKVWLFAHQLCLWFVTEEDLDKEKIYDAFISYSHKDEDFVVNKLVSKLEEKPNPFKLCLHFRDWVPGEWIPKQIANSVDKSKRTIIILSPNFLESMWGTMEFRTAHSQALSEGRARVIVVLLGDIGPTDKLDPELQAYLNMNTYVEWGDPWFWDKLRYALPHRVQLKKSNSKKMFESHQHRIQIHGDKNGLINLPGGPATPPAVTTPPADTLKTFTSNGSINKGVLITDCLKEGMTNLNSEDMKIETTTNKNEYNKNLINSQSTPV